MNWAAIRFDWNQVRAFVATAQEGSLSGAARALHISQPTVGRQIAALEEALGVVLFERNSRTLSLTQTGADLMGHATAMAEAATHMSLAASGRSSAVEGKVRITGSDLVCATILPGFVRRLAQIAPRLQIDLVADNQIRDLLHREADIAIRHVRPTQPDLIARHIGDERAYFYATPGYLARRGTPKSVEDMAAHDFIAFGDEMEMVGHMKAAGIPLTVANFPFTSQAGVVAWELAKNDLGIAIMSSSVGDATDGMLRLDIPVPPITMPTWLVTHRELHTSRKIRVVFDQLFSFLKDGYG